MTDRAAILRRFAAANSRAQASADAPPREQWLMGTVTDDDPYTVTAHGVDYVEPATIGYQPPEGAAVWIRIAAGQVPLALAAPERIVSTLGEAVDLDDYTTPGDYFQRLNANAAAGTNYPADYAGLLEVRATHDGAFVYQRYTTYREASGGTRCYVRNWYVSTWGAWNETT